MKKTALFIRMTAVVFVIMIVCVFAVSCMQTDSDLPSDNSYGTSSVAPVLTPAPDESVLPIATEKKMEVTPDDVPDTTESVLPAPTSDATPDGVHTEIAESFFHGTWSSTSGMSYIFDGTSGTITLKDLSDGAVLLEGTYTSSTEDFSEYRLSMTFHGETDSFIAWKYSDSGSVRLIIEETGATYDLLYRVDDN